MGEGCLEFACAEADGRVDGIVNPCLLEDIGSSGGGIDGKVVVEASESLASEAEDSVRQGEARVGHVVLVVGFVQALVVVVVELATGLEEEVGLEDELAVFRLECEAAVVGNAQHAVVHVDVGARRRNVGYRGGNLGCQGRSRRRRKGRCRGRQGGKGV